LLIDYFPSSSSTKHTPQSRATCANSSNEIANGAAVSAKFTPLARRKPIFSAYLPLIRPSSARDSIVSDTTGPIVEKMRFAADSWFLMVCPRSG
jgi:hypothetical protein